MRSTGYISFSQTYTQRSIPCPSFSGVFTIIASNRPDSMSWLPSAAVIADSTEASVMLLTRDAIACILFSEPDTKSTFFIVLRCDRSCIFLWYYCPADTRKGIRKAPLPNFFVILYINACSFHSGKTAFFHTQMDDNVINNPPVPVDMCITFVDKCIILCITSVDKWISYAHKNPVLTFSPL